MWDAAGLQITNVNVLRRPFGFGGSGQINTRLHNESRVFDSYLKPWVCHLQKLGHCELFGHCKLWTFIVLSCIKTSKWISVLCQPQSTTQQQCASEGCMFLSSSIKRGFSFHYRYALLVITFKVLIRLYLTSALSWMISQICSGSWINFPGAPADQTPDINRVLKMIGTGRIAGRL